MSEPDREEAIRRILVALDASPHSLAALRAAAELASRLDAELLGLYVEDIALLRLSEHPFAREVTFFSTPRQFDRQQAEQQLRGQARAARRALQSHAERARLRWSFRVVQGVVPDELLNAALEADLTVLGKVGWSRRRRLGSTARNVVLQISRPILLLEQGAHLSLPVGVVYDGSQGAQRSLRMAFDLLRQAEGYLTIIILAEDVQTAQAFQADLGERLKERNLKARFRWLIKPDQTRLQEILRFEHCGLLIMPGESGILEGETLTGLLNEMTCPVILVR